MITYTDYIHLKLVFGEERAMRFFPRTIAAMWRGIGKGQETTKRTET